MFEHSGDTCFLLTERKKGLKNHSGQISFPGGSIEEQDADVIDTAIRENQEEVGFRIRREQVLGRLTPLTIPHSGFRVYPIVSYGEKIPTLQINTEEVERIFIVPIHELLSVRNRKTTRRREGGKMITIPYFELQGQVVWGATAIILEEFRIVLRMLSG